MKRIVLVSNRLPFASVNEGGTWVFRDSVGGLATGLSAYLEYLSREHAKDAGYIWVGWPGSTIPQESREEVRCRARDQHHSFPVFLAEQDIENFYQGFCNKTIWPLFHYFPESAVYNHEFWLQYEKVNRVFCDTLAEFVQPDDVVWIHDYHLMLLPKMLRDRVPSASIGFFLHIPFPTYEIFRLMPAKWRSEILEGLLGADLIGFHTYDYMQYFFRCVLRILGYEHNMGQLIVNDRIVKGGAYPMGIDYRKFSTTSASREIQSEQKSVKKSLGEGKIVLSVDRLDYSKGIINRLQGFELMLDQNPDWRGQVMLAVIVVPSRIGLDSYEKMKKQIEEQIGRINGKFATLYWTPIRYQYKALSFESLVALYALSDVALITPLRDGMNLIAKEYIACRHDRTGILILSEMAGAAKELGEAIIINPNNLEEIAAAIKEALVMSPDEQIRRNTIMQNRLRRYDVTRWATEFIDELSTTRQSYTAISGKLLSHSLRDKLLEQHTAAARRILLLDYDGTLIGFSRRPRDAKPSDDVLRLLSGLAEDTRNDVILISGRRKEDLEEWFGTLPIALAAEHGAWIRDFKSEWKLIKPMSNEWKAKIAPILELHADRLPGAFVEEKDYALAWHYRIPDPEHAAQMARELMDDLVAFTANIDVQVLQGSKVVEVRNSGVNKGAAAKYWLEKNSYEFVLAVGDDWTDEDLFAAVPDTSFSIRVGFSQTRAHYQLRSPHDVIQLLQQIAGKK